MLIEVAFVHGNGGRRVGIQSGDGETWKAVEEAVGKRFLQGGDGWGPEACMEEGNEQWDSGGETRKDGGVSGVG